MFTKYHEGGLTTMNFERKNELIILRPINPNSEKQIIGLNENPQTIFGKIIGSWKDF